MSLKIKNAGSKNYKLIETPYEALEKKAKGEAQKPSILTLIKNKLWK